jgi:hypothetical protein
MFKLIEVTFLGLTFGLLVISSEAVVAAAM